MRPDPPLAVARDFNYRERTYRLYFTKKRGRPAWSHDRSKAIAVDRGKARSLIKLARRFRGIAYIVNLNTGRRLMPETLAERAERVRVLGLELLRDYSLHELQQIWRRLPDSGATSPPVGQRALAEHVALHLLDSKLRAADVATRDAVREIPKPNHAGDTTVRNDDTTTAETTSSAAAGTSPGGSPGRGAKAAKGARKGRPGAPKAARTTPKTAVRTGKRSTGAPSGSSARKASSKAAPSGGKGRTNGRGAAGPREGSMTAVVVAATKAGKGKEAIGAAVAKAFPKSTFAAEVKEGDYHSVAYYQRHARERGWLPSAK